MSHVVVWVNIGSLGWSKILSLKYGFNSACYTVLQIKSSAISRAQSNNLTPYVRTFSGFCNKTWQIVSHHVSASDLTSKDKNINQPFEVKLGRSLEHALRLSLLASLATCNLSHLIHLRVSLWAVWSVTHWTREKEVYLVLLHWFYLFTLCSQYFSNASPLRSL